MSIPILTTKLHILPPRPNLVHRPRLLERLNNALHHKLILISAPAGFGKTMLVSEWIAKYDHTVAWLSLDENDDEPSRFLRYLIAALQTIKPGIGDVVARLLQSAQSPLLETTLTHLLNEIATISESFALVLDDYHLLDSQPINDALIFLIDHLPPHVHLVITTREDPTLPLARYRSRDELTEIRAADLRFTATEAADFLNQIMGLELSIDEIAVLESRTEGWVAGLQMAALSMQGRADTAGFIQAFTGSHRFVLDYLVEEVLQRQPDQVSNFLVQTSILDQLNGSLCDAVTGKDGGQEMLERLERGNLFVIPLDDDRQWYRYHHLFAEVLQAYARGVEPDEVATLHLRASEWFENNNLPADAIYHAFAAQDFARAADLIELAWRAMDRSFQEVTWLGKSAAR